MNDEKMFQEFRPLVAETMKSICLVKALFDDYVEYMVHTRHEPEQEVINRISAKFEKHHKELTDRINTLKQSHHSQPPES